MEIRDDPPKAALRRLIGWAERLPLPCREGASCHLFAAKERFSLLRRLGVEAVCLAQQGRHFDLMLLFEIGAMTTNRLILLAEVSPERSFSRRSFLNLMHSRVDSHREIDASWSARTCGIQALIAAHSKLTLLERMMPLAPGEDSIIAARREATDCAVYIGFFLEALGRHRVADGDCDRPAT